MDEIVHPNYVYRSPDQELHGTEALKAFLAGYHAAFPDLQMAIDDLVVADDKAVIFFTHPTRTLARMRKKKAPEKISVNH